MDAASQLGSRFMANYTYAELRLEETQVLADLVGVLSDLQKVREFSRMLDAILSISGGDWSLVEPLSIAVIVMYGRVFSGGVRTAFGVDDLNVLTSEQRVSHDQMMAYRDKHIAHSVNDFEQNVVRAQYCSERVQDEGITAITYGQGRVIGLGRDDLQIFFELTDVFEDHVRSRMQSEQSRLVPLVRGMPLEEVLAGGHKVFEVDASKISRRRS